jgi:hypothetical protein
MEPPMKYNIAAKTACQNPWEYISPGGIGGTCKCIEIVIAMSCDEV